EKLDDDRRDDGADGSAALQNPISQRTLAARQEPARRHKREGPLRRLEEAERGSAKPEAEKSLVAERFAAEPGPDLDGVGRRKSGNRPAQDQERREVIDSQAVREEAKEKAAERDGVTEVLFELPAL